jgi:predicted transcriptional regulator
MDKRNQKVKGVTIKNRLSMECGFSRSTARRMIMELAEMNILRVFGDENNQGDFTILDFNEDFIEKFGEILEVTVKHFDN